jgi:hypothetical protein
MNIYVFYLFEKKNFFNFFLEKKPPDYKQGKTLNFKTHFNRKILV